MTADLPAFVRLTLDQTAPVTSRPDAGKVIAGDPVFTSWDIDSGDGIYAGLWQSTPGAWRVFWDGEWEYCHIHRGHSVLTHEDGTRHDLRAGDSVVIRPGFRGTWEVIETNLKDYVIRA